jgi:hypothetical protein
MGVRAEKWTEAQRARDVFPLRRLQGHRRVEGGDRVLRSGEVPRRRRPAVGLPDGTTASLTRARDPRLDFADWLLAPAKSVVHPRHRQPRLVVAPRPRHRARARRPARRQPARQPRLLARSERELVTSHYDVQAALALILNSETYQLRRWRAATTPRPRRTSRWYAFGRLDAEVIVDALNQITGTTRNTPARFPEPFTFIPENQRSIALPDGSITSSFLETFGRPARDTGIERNATTSVTAAQRLTCSTRPTCSANWSKGPKLQALSAPAAPRENSSTRSTIQSSRARRPTEEHRQ